jgi:hypothetical protein
MIEEEFTTPFALAVGKTRLLMHEWPVRVEACHENDVVVNMVVRCARKM